MNIAFAADNGYAQHLAVSIASLLSNVKTDEDICIHILDGGLSKENKSKIKALSSIHVCRFKFVEVDVTGFNLRDFQKNSTTGGYTHKVNGKVEKFFSNMVFAILLSPTVIPNVDKLIFLDSDIAVTGNIADLWNEDLGNNLLLAVEKPKKTVLERHCIGIDHPLDHPYFNSGVVVMNMKGLRGVLTAPKINTVIEKYKGKFFFHDQDMLNIMCRGRWASIHPKYNAMLYMLESKYDDDFTGYTKQEVLEAREAPCIIHFSRRPKPWHYGCVDRRKGEYFKYLNLTEFKDYKTPQPSKKDILRFYKEMTGMFLEEHFPCLHKPLRECWRRISKQGKKAF